MPICLLRLFVWVLAAASIWAQSILLPTPTIAETHGPLPMYLEANRGQFAAGVEYAARGPRYGLYLTRSEADFRAVDGTSIRVGLIGADPETRPAGEKPLDGYSNYFTGGSPDCWHTHVPHYGRVTYRGVYPGIDLTYYLSGSNLEYDFELAPGANPSLIRLSFSGLRNLRVERGGSLEIETAAGTWIHQRPLVYQESGAIRTAVGGRYIRLGPDEVGFRLSHYDRKRALIIDPVLVYATYLGGSGTTYISGAAADASGNVYVAGTTYSPDFVPGSPAPSMGSPYVAKLNAAGSALVWVSYFAGSADTVSGVAVDTAGSPYLTGIFASPNFPFTSGAYRYPGATTGSYVAKFSPAGDALAYVAAVCGAGCQATGLAVNSGNAYLTGAITVPQDASGPALLSTAGAYQPAIRPGGSDAFVAALNQSGDQFLFSTFLGGTGNDAATGIAVDSAGRAVVTGVTHSADFPTTPRAYPQTFSGISEVFATMLNPVGSALVYSTLLGGPNDDRSYPLQPAVAVDTQGNAYVTGFADFTYSIPTLCCFNSTGSAFIARIDPDGTLGYLNKFSSWNCGGYRYYSPLNTCFISTQMPIGVDSNSNVYVAGVAAAGSQGSAPAPTPGALQTNPTGPPGDTDAFLLRLDSTGAVSYSTLLGGSGPEGSVFVAVDGSNDVVVSGITESTDFPITPGAAQRTLGGNASVGGSASTDLFVAKLDLQAVLTVSNTHVGNFTQGEAGAMYTVTVSNAGPVSTSGTVTVQETIPAGLTLVSMEGAGWNCLPGVNSCTNNAVVAKGAAFSPLTVTVNVASGAPAAVTNQASVFGSGSSTASAADPTTIYAAGACDINSDGGVNIADIQKVVNEALGAAPRTDDLNHDGVINTVDVQIVINSGLNLGCSTL